MILDWRSPAKWLWPPSTGLSGLRLHWHLHIACTGPLFLGTWKLGTLLQCYLECGKPSRSDGMGWNGTHSMSNGASCDLMVLAFPRHANIICVGWSINMVADCRFLLVVSTGFNIGYPTLFLPLVTNSIASCWWHSQGSFPVWRSWHGLYNGFGIA